MNFEDLKEAGSEAAVKAAGKYRQVGRTYGKSSTSTRIRHDPR